MASPGEVGLHRVSAVLSACRRWACSAGPRRPAWRAEFASALAARGLHNPGALARPARSGLGEGHAERADAAAGPGSGAPAGRYQAVPVGVVLPAEWDGQQGEIHVQALVLAPDRAAITTSFVSTWRPAPRTRVVPLRHSPAFRRSVVPG